MTSADAWRTEGKPEPAAAPRGTDLPSVPTPTPRAENLVQLDWLDGLVRHRRWAFGLIAVVYILCFNGFWRVGLDSALYQSLARSLVRGDGYVVGGEPHHHAYPGMPLMLAGLQFVFGEGALAPMLLITLMAFAMLILTNRLIALRFPLWVATLVTIGVGLNFRVIRQSQEMMTDIPFALGVVASFYGLERLRLATRGTLWRTANAWPALIMIAGLALAAVMRPTFGVLGGAIFAAAAYRIFSNSDGRRALHATILISVCIVTVGLIANDPRTKGRSPLKGIYEQELIEGVRDLNQTLWTNLNDLLARDLNDAFFSQDMVVKAIHIGPVTPVALAASALLLISTWLVLRRDMGWGLSIVGIMVITIPLSTVPRYYIMVMPFLWLGWVLLMANLTVRAKPSLRGAVMMLGVGVPILMNVGRTGGLIAEQRTAELGVLRGTSPDRETAFYKAYRDGVVPEWTAWAKSIQQATAPTARIIAPEANILAFFADRHIAGERAIFLDKPVRQYPTVLRDWKPDYAVFPGARYSDADSRIRELISRRILVRDVTVVRDGRRADLSSVEVRLPADTDNWRLDKGRTPPAVSATKPATKPATTKPTKKKKPTTRNATTTQRATTGTTTGATQPATTRPAKKKPSKAAAVRQRAIAQQKAQAAEAREKRIAREAREARERRQRREVATTQPTILSPTTTRPTTSPAVP